jgi:agmatinase
MYGLNHKVEDSEIVIIPAPWDVTTSYHGGTSAAPEAIKKASPQLDLCHPHFPVMTNFGLAMLEISKKIVVDNNIQRHAALGLIEKFDKQEGLNEADQETLYTINMACENFHNHIKDEALKLIEKDVLIGVLGGEHSVSLGLISAIADTVDNFGILQFDAHMDLRDAYQGFVYSHASIMHNALEFDSVSRLVQVGVRDYCEEEEAVVKASKGRIKTFYDRDLKEALYEGKTWQSLCKKIVNALPDIVYISFDIDGLSPDHAPHTGTPVPGGLSFDQAMYLIHQVVKAGKQIIGFDLVEVAPGKDTDYDANVGARVLYHLAGYAHLSNEK